MSNIAANTGALLRPYFGPGGNALGIAVDPQTGNLVYTLLNGRIDFVNPAFTKSGRSPRRCPTLICGREGNDTLHGGPGNDKIEGGAGNDTITGNAGTDSCDGGTGTDSATTCESISNVP